MDSIANEDEFYINELTKSADGLVLCLTKNFPPYIFAEQERNPIIRIEATGLINVKPLELSKEVIDPYDDGVRFVINAHEAYSQLTIIDLGGRETIVNAQDIFVTELPYGEEQLWAIINYYKRELNSVSDEVNKWNRRFETLEKLSDKEIRNAELVLERAENGDAEKYLKWRVKRDLWRYIKILLAQ